MFCAHTDIVSFRVEVVGYGYRVGDRVYHRCRKCGKITVEEEGIAV